MRGRQLIALVIASIIVGLAAHIGSSRRNFIPIGTSQSEGETRSSFRHSSTIPTYAYTPDDVRLVRTEQHEMGGRLLFWDMPVPGDWVADGKLTRRYDEQTVSHTPCRVEFGAGEVVATHALIRMLTQDGPELLGFELPGWREVPLHRLPSELLEVGHSITSEPSWLQLIPHTPALAIQIETLGVRLGPIFDGEFHDRHRNVVVCRHSFVDCDENDEIQILGNSSSRGLWFHSPLTLTGSFAYDYAEPTTLYQNQPENGLALIFLEDYRMLMTTPHYPESGIARIRGVWNESTDTSTAVILSQELLGHKQLRVEAVLIDGTTRKGFPTSFDDVPLRSYRFASLSEEIDYLRVHKAQRMVRFEMDLGTIPMPSASPDTTNALDVTIPYYRTSNANELEEFLHDLLGYKIVSNGTPPSRDLEVVNRSGHEILRDASKVLGKYKIDHDKQTITFTWREQWWKRWSNELGVWFDQ